MLAKKSIEYRLFNVLPSPNTMLSEYLSRGLGFISALTVRYMTRRFIGEYCPTLGKYKQVQLLCHRQLLVQNTVQISFDAQYPQSLVAEGIIFFLNNVVEYVKTTRAYCIIGDIRISESGKIKVKVNQSYIQRVTDFYHLAWAEHFSQTCRYIDVTYSILVVLYLEMTPPYLNYGLVNGWVSRNFGLDLCRQSSVLTLGQTFRY